MLKKIKKFITLPNIIVFSLTVAAFVLRIFNIGKTLNFYYDQGRDALVIWDLIHSHKFFLIGPTTGLPGIFRGPYYYYLIAPFYFLGKGNPVWSSAFLSFISVLSIPVIYYLALKSQGKAGGILAAIVAAFSFNVFLASRWLSNPTPMLLLSLVLVWAMFKVTEKKKWGWPIIAFVSGLSLFNFGSSGELFYFLAILVFLIWQWKNRPDVKNLIFSIVLFCITFAPLAIFDYKHEHILLNNIVGTFGGGSGSFKIPSLDFIKGRFATYFDIFFNKIFQSFNIWNKIFLGFMGVSFFIFLPKMLRSTKIKVVLLILLSAIFGLLFYQGNYGILYDYYMTGYYLIFILLFAILLGFIWKTKFVGKIIILIFLYLFMSNNIPVTLGRINDTCQGEESICLVNQKQAIDWIYNNARNRKFNVDVYVPPVIPYAYNYLFKWLGTNYYNKLPEEKQISLLYTLYEDDPPHPERLQAWLDRQKTIGKIISEKRFGGITVQERERIIKK